METSAQVTSREFADLSATLKQNTKVVEELTHLIRGNGQPGIVLRIDRVERAIDIDGKESIAERIATLEKEWVKLNSFLGKLLWGIGIPLALGVIGFLVALWTHSIEINFK